MDPVTGIILALVIVIVLGYVSRYRARSAAKLEWTIDTAIDDAELEQLIRQHLRGYLPVGRVQGSVAEGSFTRRIWRYAINLNSEATVVIKIGDRHPGLAGSRTLRAGMENCEVETVAGAAHPAWSAPLAARRRLNALLRALQVPAGA